MLADTGRPARPSSGIAARAAIADYLGRGPCARPLRGAADADRRHRPRSAVALADPADRRAPRLPRRCCRWTQATWLRRVSAICCAQPRAPLTLRFGPELGRRLDQALGRLAEPIEPVRPAELDRGPPRLRRADRRGRDHRPLHRQAGRSALRRPGGKGSGGTAPRSALSPRRQPRSQAVRVGTAMPVRDAKRLTRLLCDKIETIDPGFGIEVMTLTATIAEPLRAEAGRIVAGRGAGARRLRPDRYARQPRRRARGSTASRRSRATCPNARCAGSRRWRRRRADWPGHWPRPVAPAARAGADRDRGAAAGSSAGRRSPGAASAGGCSAPMAPSGSSANGGSATPSSPPCATTFRSRTRPANATGSTAPAMARTPPPARIAGSCMGFSDERLRAMPSCRSPRISASCAAPPPARSCSRKRRCSASRRWRSSTAIRSPASCAPTRPRKQPACGLIVGCRLDLADGMSVLVYPTDRPAYARLCRLLSLGKKRGGKAQVPSRLGRSRRLWRGPDRRARAGRGRRRLRAAPAPAARTPSATAPIWR